MKPMLANSLEIGLAKHLPQWERIVNQRYYMETKLDGMRLILKFNEGVLVSAFTRSGRDVLDNIPELWRARIIRWDLPTCVLDCEFGYTLLQGSIIDFNQTMRVMGSGRDEAQRKASEISDLPIAHVFDILEFGGADLTRTRQSERRGILVDIINSRRGHPSKPNKVPYIMDLTDYWDSWDESIYTELVNEGCEGVILKNPMAPYVFEKRPTQTWYKVKKFATIDTVVVGFQDGQGKYTGQIGAIKYGLIEDGKLKEWGQVSGMSDFERAAISTEPGVYMGKVMEVRYFGLTAGTPRHPQFIRFRDDKKDIECGTDQII